MRASVIYSKQEFRCAVKDPPSRSEPLAMGLTRNVDVQFADSGGQAVTFTNKDFGVFYELLAYL